MVDKIKVIFLAVAMAISAPVWADPLKSVLEAFLVVSTTNEDGETVESLAPVEAADPGSLIEYVLTYTNESDEPLVGFAIKTPVPKNTTYQADTASASVKAEFRVSVDGGDTFETAPVTRTVIEKGQVKEIVLPPSVYDALSWDVSKKLPPKQNMSMRYRVVID